MSINITEIKKNRAGSFMTAMREPIEKITIEGILGNRFSEGQSYGNKQEEYQYYMPSPLSLTPQDEGEISIKDALELNNLSIKAYGSLWKLNDALNRFPSKALPCDEEENKDELLVEKKREYFRKELLYYAERYDTCDQNRTPGTISHEFYDSFCLENLDSYKKDMEPEELAEARAFLKEREAFEKSVARECQKKRKAFLARDNAFDLMLYKKEALASFKMKGSLVPEAKLVYPESDDSVYPDLQCINQYAKALERYALAKPEINSHYLCELHSLVLGAYKPSNSSAGSFGFGFCGKYDADQSIGSGKFRKTQTWIGASLKDAVFVPPEPSAIPALMTNLKDFMKDEPYDALIYAARIFYQFSTIRPFETGNGHIGRLLIPMYLTKKGILDRPVLCLSSALNKRRENYIKALDEVRRTGDDLPWIKEFLKILHTAAEDTYYALNKILKLHSDCCNIIDYTYSKNTVKSKIRALQVFYYLEEHPVTNIKSIAEALGVQHNVIDPIMDKFCDLNIFSNLVKRTRRKQALGKEPSNIRPRNRIYVFEEYYQILNGGERFEPKGYYREIKKSNRNRHIWETPSFDLSSVTDTFTADSLGLH